MSGGKSVQRLMKLSLNSDCQKVCIFSHMQRDSTPALSVGRSVGWLVGRSHFTFEYVFCSLTILLLPKCSGELKYGPCPPARNWGSRVSSLVNCLTVDITDSEIK